MQDAYNGIMSIGTWLYTRVHGRCVGKDMFGNRYFVSRKKAAGKREKRWVVYKGMAEPSKVPPLWHAWLHHIIDKRPDELDIPEYDWMKDHLPNLTGTANAYKPRGHLERGTSRDPSTSDYEAWTP